MNLTKALQLITTENTQIEIERFDGTEVTYYRGSVYDELYGYGRTAEEAIIRLADHVQETG